MEKNITRNMLYTYFYFTSNVGVGFGMRFNIEND